MTDEKEQTEPVEQEETTETQEESLPSTETTEDTQTEEGLPENVKERTRKRFEALNEKLKEFKQSQKPEEEQEKRSVFETLKQPQPEQPYQPEQHYNPNNFVQEDGTVDINALNASIYQAQMAGKMSLQQAEQLRQEVQQREERLQERETYEKFIELNPKSDSYDPALTDLVADRMARYMARGENKSLVEVAEEIVGVYARRKPNETVVKEAVDKYQKAQEDRKSEGPIEQGKGDREDDVDVEELRKGMREGDLDTKITSLSKRLKAAGM